MKQLSAALVFILCISSAPCFAGGTEIISFSSREDFADGVLKGVSISQDGRIHLAGSLSELWQDENETMVLDIAVESGGSLLVGTANEGKIFRIKKTGEVELLLDSPEIAVLSILAGHGKVAYAGTAPDGLIYALEPGKTPRVMARTGSRYVWDLESDGKGNIWAVTGDPARVIRYAVSGEETLSLEIEAEHIRTAAINGSVCWVGTANPASIYRIDGEDLQLVHSGKEAEISSIAVDSSGIVWFSAVSSPAISGAEIRPGMALKPYENDPKNGEYSFLYRISRNGVVEQWWSTRAIPIFSLQADDDALVVACGGQGYLFRIDGPDQATLLGMLDGQPITSIYSVESKLYCGTGSGAGVMVLEKEPVSSGSYESRVFDCQVVSVFGKMNITGTYDFTGSLRIESRSGNSEEPDDLWSEWASVTPDDSGMQVASPSARFIQWRVHLTASKTVPVPTIDGVELAIVRPNRSPRFKALTVYPVSKGVLMDQMGGGKLYRQEFADGTRFDYVIRNTAGNGLPKGRWFKLRGMRTAQWSVRDPDNDILTHEIAIRPVKARNWVILERAYQNPIFSFDSTAFPDGEYMLRVTVSDDKSNPVGHSLRAQRISQVFQIDNSPPEIHRFTVTPAKSPGSVRISGEVRDKISRIHMLEYSVDSDQWFSFVGEDGILDSSIETFNLSIKLDEIPVQVFLRATDLQENVATSAATL